VLNGKRRRSASRRWGCREEGRLHPVGRRHYLRARPIISSANGLSRWPEKGRALPRLPALLPRRIKDRYPNIERVEVPYEHEAGNDAAGMVMKAPGAGRSPRWCFSMARQHQGTVDPVRGCRTCAARHQHHGHRRPGQGERCAAGNPERHDYEVPGGGLRFVATQ